MSASYHDLFITTPTQPRTPLFNLPYNVTVTCTRTSGWEVWRGETLLGGEYSAENWVVLDVKGLVIADGRKYGGSRNGQA